MVVVTIYWEENFVKSKNVRLSWPTLNLFVAIIVKYEVGTEEKAICVSLTQEKEERINNGVVQPSTIFQCCKVFCSKAVIFPV